MGRVAPPNKDVRFFEDVLREAMLRLLQRGGANGDAWLLGNAFRDGRVHALWVDRTHNLVFALVHILSPNRDAKLAWHVA